MNDEEKSELAWEEGPQAVKDAEAKVKIEYGKMYWALIPVYSKNGDKSWRVFKGRAYGYKMIEPSHDGKEPIIEKLTSGVEEVEPDSEVLLLGWYDSEEGQVTIGIEASWIVEEAVE